MKVCTGAAWPCGDACPLVGYGFVMVQDTDRMYDYESAFITGTIFPELSYHRGKYGPNEIFS